MKISKVPFFVAWFLTSATAQVNLQPDQFVSTDGILNVELDVAFGTSLNGARNSPLYNGESSQRYH